MAIPQQNQRSSIMSKFDSLKKRGGQLFDSLVDTSPKALLKGIYNGTGKAVDVTIMATGAVSELVVHTIKSSRNSGSTVGNKVSTNFNTGRVLTKEALKSKESAPKQQEFEY